MGGIIAMSMFLRLVNKEHNLGDFMVCLCFFCFFSGCSGEGVVVESV